ncbi:acyl carrier protein, partial [Clostridium beijerinckii]
KLENYLLEDQKNSEDWIASKDGKSIILSKLKGERELEDFIQICKKRKSYKLLVGLWVSGIQVEWNMLFTSKEVHRLHLPTYPFQRKSFWISGRSPYEEVDITYKGAFDDKTDFVSEEEIVSEVTVSSIDITDDLREMEINHLKMLFSKISKLSIDEIESNKDMEEYGIDSILIKNLSCELEKELGQVSVTIFFQCRTIEALADYFIENYNEKLKKFFHTENNGIRKENERNTINTVDKIQPKHRNRGKRRLIPKDNSDNIAIIGVSGKYPQANNLDELWENLKQGKDCVEKIPSDRWDYHENFDEDKTKPGKINSKWGGFINDANTFDPLFFNITPQEA